jgi:hypothetical protein
MKNGVPFDKLFSIDFFEQHEREAMSIVFSQFEGGEFDWNSWSWVEKT